jgi:cytochrome c-type biogenesis protein CcmE
MRRRTRFLLVLALGAAGASIAAAGALPEGVVSVRDIAAQPDRFVGHEIHVKAVVQEGSVERGDGVARFAVTDEAATLPVEYAGTLPEQFGAGRTVVVSGVLEARGDALVLRAASIQGGCASKYEPAPEGAPA